MARLQIHPDYRALLEANGLADFEALFAAGEGKYVDGHRNRSVSRLELRGPQGETVGLYLKRRWDRAAGRDWAQLLSLRPPTRHAAREWENARRLAGAGIPVAEPIALGESGGPDRPRSLLAVREIAGPSLAAWLRDPSSRQHHRGHPGLRRMAAEAVARTVRRLHDGGFAFRDLYAKHVFLEGIETPQPRAVLIDAQGLRRATARRRVRDLAALYSTTLVPGVRRTDRVRFFLAYLGRPRLDREARRLARMVEREACRVAGRGRDPNLIPERQVAPPGMVPLAHETFEIGDGARVRINRAFRPHLEAAGLTTLDRMMAMEGGRPYRAAAGRLTVRAELRCPGRKPVAVYIKRHTAVPFWTGLRRAIGLGEPHSFASTEAANIYRATDAGIPTMRIVAIGEQLLRRGRQERSCLITQEVPGGIQADDYCQKTFGPEAAHPDESPRATGDLLSRKRRLIRSIAHLAHRLHAAGLAHRDFYLCHILVRPQGEDEPVLHLIDLQRLRRARDRIPRRWVVKDLAALLFSSWPSPATKIRSDVFTSTDRMRFAHEYFQARRLARSQKRLVRLVFRKAERTRRHEERRRRRSGQAG